VTIYFCPRCKTKDHWANEVCPKTNGETPLDQPVLPEKSAGVDRPERRPEQIRRVEEFLRKVGRPRLNRTPEEKRRMRTEYMRRRRAKC